jgi:hypothetical protein
MDQKNLKNSLIRENKLNSAQKISTLLDLRCSLVIREMQIEITVSYHQAGYSEKDMTLTVGNVWCNWNSHTPLLAL